MGFIETEKLMVIARNFEDSEKFLTAESVSDAKIPDLTAAEAVNHLKASCYLLRGCRGCC